MSGGAPAAIERLHASSLPRVLFVSHKFGGGVRRHIDDLARALAANAEVLLLQPLSAYWVALRWLRAGETLTLWFHVPEDLEGLVRLLEGVGIDRVHFHHVHGLPRQALDLPVRLQCPHDVTLHDYYPACPAYHLTGAAGRFCGGQPSCRECLSARPAQWGLSIDAWRALFADLLGKAERVIAPSQDAGRRIEGFFPAVKAKVWPHAQSDEAPPPSPVRVLVPGAISPEKGMGVLEACVQDAAATAKPLHFRVLGFTARPIKPWPDLPYSLTGEYPEGRLPELLALERGDVIFFPAQVAETFSYTLSAALATGLPIVATDLGALPERLAAHPGARVVPWNAPAGAINDVLLREAAPTPANGPAENPMTAERYRALYAEALAPRARPPLKPMRHLETHWQTEPVLPPDPWTLTALFDDGVGCGRASSLELLRTKAREVDHALANPDTGDRSRPSRIGASLRALARRLRR